MDDDELLAALKDATMAADPMPPGVADVARRAIEWDIGFSELLQQTYDSATGASGLRGEGSRDLTFELPGVELEVTLDEGSNAAEGWLSPSDAKLELITPGQEPIAVDSAGGRFEIAVPFSVFALRVTLRDQRSVQTPLLPGTVPEQPAEEI